MEDGAVAIPEDPAGEPITGGRPAPGPQRGEPTGSLPADLTFPLNMASWEKEFSFPSRLTKAERLFFKVLNCNVSTGIDTMSAAAVDLQKYYRSV